MCEWHNAHVIKLSPELILLKNVQTIAPRTQLFDLFFFGEVVECQKMFLALNFFTGKRSQKVGRQAQW